MRRAKTYKPELREEAVTLVLTQGLTLDDAAHRVTIPKGTLANWVAGFALYIASRAGPDAMACICPPPPCTQSGWHGCR